MYCIIWRNEIRHCMNMQSIDVRQSQIKLCIIYMKFMLDLVKKKRYRTNET